MDQTDAFQQLSPDDILNAIDAAGFQCSGHIYPLNSYENRVYQVGLEDSDTVIAKFYRPGRWSDNAITEEHQFTQQLKSEDLPVISPIMFGDNTSLKHTDLFRFSLYESVGGRTPELDNPEHLKMLGRILARMHNIGEVEDFRYRRKLNVTDFAEEANQYLLDNEFIPIDLLPAYESLIGDVIDRIRQRFEETEQTQSLRIHGDFHLGNILWREETHFIVDFDDTMMGPAIQDIWMLLSGDRDYMTARLDDILDGYCQFRHFNPVELNLIEALRALRIIHYAGWIAKRWEDPAFPIAFPWFNTQRYWQDHILALREQIAAMEEPPLTWSPG
jgi:Ser/Thr protein kinase RdoA (MazF antagonist)